MKRLIKYHNNYKILELNINNFNLYKNKFPKYFFHIAQGNNFKGFIIEQINNSQKNFIGVINCNIDNGYVQALEINEYFRNKGFGTKLLKLSRDKLNIFNLSVNKKNINAINLYKKLGYIIISKTDKMLFMEFHKT